MKVSASRTKSCPDSTRAREAYPKELASNPNSGIAMYNLGKMDVDQNKPATGVELLRRAVAAHLTGAPVTYYLGYGLAQLDQNVETSGWLETALASSPSPLIQQSTLFRLGRVYRKLGRDEEARILTERLSALKAQTSPQSTATGSLSTSGDTTVSAGPKTAEPPR